MKQVAAKIIDGRALADQIQNEVKDQMAKLGIAPGLAVVLVGSDPASLTYVKLKEKAARAAGINFHLYTFSADAKENDILASLDWLNKDPEIDAIIVQLPLPPHLDEHRIIGQIDPAKDVDGFHPDNIKQLLSGQSYIIPGLASGILQLIQSTNEAIAGKQALIIARSPEFTGALSYLLRACGVKAESRPPDDAAVKRALAEADIVIAAAGRPQWIKGRDIKAGAIIIDVGVNRLGDAAVVGDVDFSDCAAKAAAITPVPGGVGPMTVAMLLKNTVALAIRRLKTIDR